MTIVNKEQFQIPVRAPVDTIYLIDKLILLSQLGLSKQRYNSRTEFVTTALKKQGQELLKAIQDVPQLRGVLSTVLEDHDKSCLQ